MATCPTCQKEVPEGASVCPTDGTPLGRTRLIGQVLGERYRITGALGEGGMGTVYLAEHVVLGKRFAVKVLRPELSMREDLVKRFQQEAIAASRIGQENIVGVIDFGRTPDGQLYYVMEALEGESLTALLRKEDRLPVGRALKLLAQVARALGAAHSRGIVHRDVKPDNIFIVPHEDGAESAKVIDFGISMVTGDSSPGERITRAGMIIGTPEYMSPEQGDGTAVVDHRSDVYAWGVVAYETLTGTLPFNGNSPVDVLVAHKNAAPEPLTTRAPDANIPAEVEALVLRALAKRPEDRPASMTEVAREAQRIAAHLQGLPTPAPATPAPITPIPLTPVPREPTLSEEFFLAKDLALDEELGEAGPVGGRSHVLELSLGALVVAALGAGVIMWKLSSTAEPPTEIPLPAPAPVAQPLAVPPPVPAEPAAPAADPPPPTQAAEPAPPPPVVAEPAAVPSSVRRVRLTSVPSGAAVFRGKTRLGTTPLTVDAPPDAEVLRFTLSGHATVKRKLEPGADSLEVRLEAVAKSRPKRDDGGKVEDLKDDPYR